VGLYGDHESEQTSSPTILRTCKKCLVPKPLDRFGTFTTRKGNLGRRGKCFDCRDLYAQEHFDELAEYRRTYNKIRRSAKRERDHLRRMEVKKAVDELKKAPCTDCGRSFPPVAMDFDHVGPKSRTIAGMVSGAYKLELILEEIKKCELVCAVCHRLRTSVRKENVAGPLKDRHARRIAPRRRSTTA
jgi:hypothetical protein